MVKTKICGIRRPQDIEFLNLYRPEYAGFILSAGFKRSINAQTFCELKKELDSSIKAVGVFVDEKLSEIKKHYADKLDVIQLHGNEGDEYISKLREFFGGEIWKAVRAKTAEDIELADKLSADKLVIDSFVEGKVGGTGKQADTEVIKKARITKPFFIAGGVSEQNVKSLIEMLRPFGADISSSVETDGFKDKDKIGRIITLIREEN
ncbi:MAG: phosphoribosylanthranilate isomerase [Ruminococcus sp.]|nr:phosphoribosylanthranilate isomerase [Ruminococcus sp.]